MDSLRRSVMRDLEWLLNSTNLDYVVDLSDYPELESTVINYGLPALSGRSTNRKDQSMIEQLLKDAIINFEPRIFAHTVRVTFLEDSDSRSANAFRFQIEGTLWGNPMPEALYLHTEMDLEFGQIKIGEGRG